MKRVVMFTNTYHPMIGGLERSVENTHVDLNASGHLCRVITPEFKNAEESRDGVLRIPALKGFGEREFSIPLPATSKLQHWVEAIDPHLLHAHQPFLLGDTAWRIAQLRGLPLVFTHHTLYERYAHYLHVDLERARRLVIELTIGYANRCQLVIAPTESIRSLLLERGVETPIEVAASGIDWPMFSGGSRERGRRAFALAANDEVIGHLGRLSQEKNLEFIVEAVIRVMKRRRDTKFLLVGDGDRLAWARERFEDEGLTRRLVAPGLLSGPPVADAYAAMDVFAFASHSDTQGLVIAEAMSARVPIVALSAFGARDYLQDQEVGTLLPGNASAEEFASALEALLADDARRHQLAQNAFEHSKSYGRPACLERLLEIYDRAIRNYRPVDATSSDRWEQLATRFDVEWTPFLEKVTTTFRALATDMSLSRPGGEGATERTSGALRSPGPRL